MTEEKFNKRCDLIRNGLLGGIPKAEVLLKEGYGSKESLESAKKAGYSVKIIEWCRKMIENPARAKMYVNKVNDAFKQGYGTSKLKQAFEDAKNISGVR